MPGPTKFCYGSKDYLHFSIDLLFFFVFYRSSKGEQEGYLMVNLPEQVFLHYIVDQKINSQSDKETEIFIQVNLKIINQEIVF